MQKPVTKAQGMLLLIFVNVMWGLSFIFSKAALSEGMPTMTLALIRYVITAAILVPLCLRQEGGIRLRRWAPRAFVTTLLGITVYYYFEYTSLSLTTASAASLIASLIPMMTLLARMLFFRERIGALRWGCVLASLAGVYLVISADADGGGGSLAGNLIMILACLCWTGYILISPKLMQACSATRVTTWQAVAAVVTLFPFALAERGDWVPLSARVAVRLFAGRRVLRALLCALRHLHPLGRLAHRLPEHQHQSHRRLRGRLPAARRIAHRRAALRRRADPPRRAYGCARKRRRAA